MNDQPRKLREIVERATTTGGPSSRHSDAETDSLREGWLRFGELIEEELRHGGARPTNRRMESMPRIQPRYRLGRSRWFAVLAASLLAASLLVAIGVAFAVRFVAAPRQRQAELRRIAGANPFALPRAKPPAEPAVAPHFVPKLSPPPAAPRQSDANFAAANERLQWGDAVDDEINALGQATIYTQQDGPSSRVWAIEAGLDQLNREVEHGNL